MRVSGGQESLGGADDRTYPEQLKINAHDVDLAIREASRPMQLVYDPDHGYLPYFSNIMSGADPRNGHNFSYSLSHVPGRWLNALLRAEEIAGIVPDEAVIERLRFWAIRSLSNPMHLPACMDLTTFEPVLISDLHNLREVTHAMNALIKYRSDPDALHLIRAQIETINIYFDFSTGLWDERRFHRTTGGRTMFSPRSALLEGGLPDGPQMVVTFPSTFGRYIGSLVKLYKTTGFAEALVQAIKLKDYAFTNVLPESGYYDPIAHGPHTHSTTSMVSGIALLGQELGDKSILDRVHAFMNNGLWQIAAEFGWCTENYLRTDLYGEINNTSDMIETCLILANAGFEGYFQRAERMIRGHLLPSQLLDTSFISNWDAPGQDFRDHLADKSKGAFGFPCPVGHEYEEGSWISFNWDIVGGAVDGLCDIVCNRVSSIGNLTSVNLMFDHHDDRVRVTGPYSNADVLKIEAKLDQTIRVHLSDWCDADNMVIRTSNDHNAMTRSGEWLYFSGVCVDDVIEIVLPMTTSTINYSVKEELFTIRWRGDAVSAASGRGKRLRFFPQLVASEE